MTTGVILKTLELPKASECSFCWSVATVLQSLGIEVTISELCGFSLNAFAIWANASEPVKLWKEANCDLFVETLLRSLGLRGQLLSIPDDKQDLLGYFLYHWKGRLENSLQAGIPVAASGVWPQFLWGVITEWDEERRLIKGLIPGSNEELTNSCWPRKLLTICGPAVSPRIDAIFKVLLHQAKDLGANEVPQGKWVSGLDAYILWRELVIKQYTREPDQHADLASHLAQARKEATLFLSHHADFYNAKTERMMLALARRYNRIAGYLKEATSAPGERPFIAAITEALAEEEKALVLLEELLFYLE
jgi:hypothetical protein